MAEILRYVVVNEDDTEDDFEHENLAEAIEAASGREPCAVVMRTYAYDDSELVWTSTGAETWPPDSEKSRPTRRRNRERENPDGQISKADQLHL